MFQVQAHETGKSYRLAVVGLLLLSAAALAISIWEMVDFVREQKIVAELIQELPREATDSAEVLAVELRWQFRLTILVILNVVVTGIAVVLLSRAYRSSQKSLRDIKVLAADILSSMDQGVITTDRSGAVTSINRRGLELLDLDTECLGRSLNELCDAVQLETFRRDWMINQSVAMTRDFKTTTDGQDRVLRAFCQTLNDIDGNEIGFVIQLRDVTARVLIEERMRRMERYMGLGSLAAGLHHEIKNPLAALSLHVQLLEELLERGNPCDDVRQMLGVIKTEVKRIGDVLEGFRDFASVEKLNLTTVNLKELIRRQIDLVSPQAAEQSVRIDLHLADDLPGEIEADGVRLEQVLLNLLVNAMQAMPRGGTLTVAACCQAEAVVLEVSDTGSGIPEDLHDKVFDPYFTTKSRGTGLGLTLCDKIVRQHSGALEFRSSPQGTTFRMTLPTVNQTDNSE